MKTYDAVIVGTGPVGSLLAHLFAEKNLRVLVIEKNSDKSSAQEQKPDFIDSINDSNYCPVESGRAGGNCWLWGGKCYLFDIETLKSWGFDEQEIISSEQSLQKLLDQNVTAEHIEKGHNVAESFRLKNKNIFEYLNIENDPRIEKLYESIIINTNAEDSLHCSEVLSNNNLIKIQSKKIIFCCGAFGNAFNLSNLFQASHFKFSDHPHFKLRRHLFSIHDEKDLFGRSYITNKRIERALYLENSDTKLCGQIDYRSSFSGFFKKLYLQTNYQIVRNFLSKFEYISRFFIYRLHKISSELFEWEFWSSQNAHISDNFIYQSNSVYRENLRKISIMWSVNSTSEIYNVFNRHGSSVPYKKISESLRKSRSGLHPSTHLPYVLGSKLNGMFELDGYDGIYFISSGSFPDGHVFNPTWTSMVLAQLWFKKESL